MECIISVAIYVAIPGGRRQLAGFLKPQMSRHTSAEDWLERPGLRLIIVRAGRCGLIGILRVLFRFDWRGTRLLLTPISGDPPFERVV